jgi:hypothetical protein
MKVFAGNQNPVPTAVMIEALNRIQGGAAKAENLLGLGKALDIDCTQCDAGCGQRFQQCLGTGQQTIDEIPTGQLMSCQQDHLRCSSACPA